ncbi:MAG: complement resistance protein TraT [Desulfovibrionaceae bacterium]
MNNALVLILMLCYMLSFSSCSVPPKVDILISEAIFINPEYLHKKPIYLSIKNHTDLDGIESQIYTITSSLLSEKGFSVTTKSEESDYKVTVIILNLVKNIDRLAPTTSSIFSGKNNKFNKIEKTLSKDITNSTMTSGIDIFGQAISRSMEDEFWYGEIGIQIEEPGKIISKKQINQMSDSNVHSSVAENLDILSKTTHTITNEEIRSILKTKLFIKVSSPEIDKVQAIEYIVEALSYKLVNFFK